MLVGNLPGRIFALAAAENPAPREVQADHFSHDEGGGLQEGAQRDHRVPGLQAPGARLHQQGIEDEVVVAIHQEDLGGEAPNSLLQRLGAVGSREASTQNDDAIHWNPRVG